jgi:hypothetical protein
MSDDSDQVWGRSPGLGVSRIPMPDGRLPHHISWNTTVGYKATEGGVPITGGLGR